MKFSTISAFFALTNANPKFAGSKLTNALQRGIRGEWVDQMTARLAASRNRRSEVDGVKGFRPLAAMIMYMQGSDVYEESEQDFEAQLKTLEDTYTSYGCYCWMQGTADGLVGGGLPMDVTDHFCKELYFCYKCVNLDYSQNYSDVQYFVDFSTDSSGDRALDCSNNGKNDAENICECDKRFAENIAATKKSCKGKAGAHPLHGEYCLNEAYRTSSGINAETNQAGSFRPNHECVKSGVMDIHEKDNCCGIYPTRYPYDSKRRECCRKSAVDGNLNKIDIFELIRKNECKADGGEVVVSKKGDPHNYMVV